MVGRQASCRAQRTGLDFLEARRLFDGRDIYTVPSPRGREQRWVKVGELDEVMVAAV
jgi:hypothetical protein